MAWMFFQERKGHININKFFRWLPGRGGVYRPGGGGVLPTGGQRSKVYVLCAEPKEHKRFRPGARPGGIGFPAGRIGDRGDREIVYVPNVYVPLPAPILGKEARWRGCSSALDAFSFPPESEKLPTYHPRPSDPCQAPAKLLWEMQEKHWDNQETPLSQKSSWPPFTGVLLGPGPESAPRSAFWAILGTCLGVPQRVLFERFLAFFWA